jgi:hypothetical protein
MAKRKGDDITSRVGALETKVVELATSVDRRLDDVDRALVEQRQYTEFAYTQLDARMDAGFAGLDAKMDAGFAGLDAKMDAGFARIDRKLEQFIDAQIDTNLRVDQRVRALERKRRV